MEAYDKIPLSPSLQFSSYIDDTVLSAVGTRRHVLHPLVEGLKFFIQQLALT